MKNDNKSWLFWGFIGLVILNVILLAYIVVGLGGKDIRLGPNPGDVDCNDNDPNDLCRIGDGLGNTVVDIKGSKIRDTSTIPSDDNRLTLVAGVGKKGIKMTGVTSDGKAEQATNVLINGILGVSNRIIMNSYDPTYSTDLLVSADIVQLKRIGNMMYKINGFNAGGFYSMDYENAIKVNSADLCFLSIRNGDISSVNKVIKCNPKLKVGTIDQYTFECRMADSC